MGDNAYRKLINSNFFCYSLYLYFQQTFEKDFEVVQNVKILTFEGNWHDF